MHVSPRIVGGSGLAFVGFALVVAAQNRLGAASFRPPDEVPSFLAFVGIELPVWLTWWLVLPLIETARRWLRPLRARRRIVWLVGHLAAGLLLSWLSLATVVAFRTFVWFPFEQNAGFWRALTLAHSNGFALRLLIYGGLVAVLELLDVQRDARRRAMRESSLRADLADARLEGLRARLQPHFLFNTLNAVSSLMSRDVAAARTALVHLSDLLRGMLDESAERGEVSLLRELDWLERYVELLRLRFGDRLSFRTEVAADLLVAQVPTFLLQPLVENAVVHGLERQPGDCSIHVVAAREDDHLTLRVRDDGPGPVSGWRPGVGLGTSLARLDTLYGERAGLRLRARPGGGASVEVWLPWRTG